VFALEVNLEPRNDQSLAFHAALGFVEVGQQMTDYGTRVSLMTKPLQSRPAVDT
jgi:predicted GNAT superfamily acetyltransferase